MVPDVIAETAAKVFHEVIGADVVRITRSGGARLVESRVGRADASHKVKASLLTETRLVKQVEVGQNRAEVFFLADVDALSSPPGGFDVKAETVLEKDRVTAEVEIEAALFRRERAVGSGGRQERAAAQKDVTLLGRGKLGEEQEGENGCEKH
jgi:hypothetical protein